MQYILSVHSEHVHPSRYGFVEHLPQCILEQGVIPNKKLTA